MTPPLSCLSRRGKRKKANQLATQFRESTIYRQKNNRKEKKKGKGEEEKPKIYPVRSSMGARFLFSLQKKEGGHHVLVKKKRDYLRKKGGEGGGTKKSSDAAGQKKVFSFCA